MTGPRPIRIGVVGDAEPIEPTREQAALMAAQICDALGANLEDVDVTEVILHGPPVYGYVELQVTIKCPYVAEV